jgi:hypothetical protein
MAIDGLVVKTRQPKKDEVGLSVKSYRNRKGCWGIIVLGGCDARCRFTMWSARHSGGTHDALVWQNCALKRALDAGRLPPEYYIIGELSLVVP